MFTGGTTDSVEVENLLCQLHASYLAALWITEVSVLLLT